MDLVSFYIKRKKYLDDINRKKNSSPPLKKRMLDILSNEAAEIAVYEIEQEVTGNIPRTFEERFNLYLKEIGCSSEE